MCLPPIQRCQQLFYLMQFLFTTGSFYACECTQQYCMNPAHLMLPTAGEPEKYYYGGHIQPTKQVLMYNYCGTLHTHYAA